MAATPERVQFGDFEFDVHLGKLTRDGATVKIQPQPLRVLRILLERPGEVVARDDLRARIWGEATFVEFDQGLNYCIRQIRLALGEDASRPTYIETLPKQGYRLIAPVEVKSAFAAATPTRTRGWSRGRVAARSGLVLALIAAEAYVSLSRRPVAVRYTQLTDFADSALAPVLSPDGHMVAFIRGNDSFMTADQIYVKMLPNGEARRLTNDPRLKYHIAFSPDGSQIAYTVLDAPNWSTYTVSTLGGDPQLLMKNAAGLSWLDQHQLLFSQTRSGQHLGIVTGTASRSNFRELYFPAHERAMAHASSPSPDHKRALVVEMDGNGHWAPCRLISLLGDGHDETVGPRGGCTAAQWSPDGSWMYFSAYVNGKNHLWRQRYPQGEPERITSGPVEEAGVAVDPDGHSLITGMGGHESTTWIHDADGERSLSSEGEASAVSLRADDSLLFYLQRRESVGQGWELWRMTLATGETQAVFPGTSMMAYDVSPDGKDVVYITLTPDSPSQLWIGPIDKSSPAMRVGTGGETSPYFGPHGRLLFLRAEGNFNYLEQMNRDGSGRSKVVQYPVNEIQGISPGRRWVMGETMPDGKNIAAVAIPADGGPPQRVCASWCSPVWSSNGSYLFVAVEFPSRTGPGRSLAIPVGPGERLPELPPSGIPPFAQPSVIPGSQSVPRVGLVPGKDPSHYVYVNVTVHWNLYRISLP